MSVRSSSPLHKDEPVVRIGWNNGCNPNGHHAVGWLMRIVAPEHTKKNFPFYFCQTNLNLIGWCPHSHHPHYTKLKIQWFTKRQFGHKKAIIVRNFSRFSSYLGNKRTCRVSIRTITSLIIPMMRPFHPAFLVLGRCMNRCYPRQVSLRSFMKVLVSYGRSSLG